MTFEIRGLDPEQFQDYFHQSAEDLASRAAIRVPVKEADSIPDRVTLRDLPVGSTALLLNYEHLGGNTPYRARHAIFVHEGPAVPGHFVGEVPRMLWRRPLALRGIDARGHIVEANLATGEEIQFEINRLLANEDVTCIHAHFAKHGCFACRIDRRSEP